MQQRWYLVSLQPVHPRPPPPTHTTLHAPGAVAQPIAISAFRSPGRPALRGFILSPAKAQASAISDCLELHLAGFKPACALDAVLKDGIPAPQPSQTGLDISSREISLLAQRMGQQNVSKSLEGDIAEWLGPTPPAQGPAN